MSLKALQTVADVFEALGGNGGLESITGSKPSTISMWKKAGKFPSKTYVTMTAALHANGKTAPASLWGMKTKGRGA
ncbi:hypothetical protein [Bradyrhizobium sp. Leo121]|uniref:hypothetical protein n=1 Tax=Bradyrhizobium sp. Leo121 TaxID=1571195 RepID=UPI001028967F|nr:hypothetical protein [Bradyrhizobium sp. Leo121]RZN19488.1 hypothetical protein CWO90_35245 [Bradyrhizobium sp. Leo121]